MIRVDKAIDCCGCNACVQICPKQCIVMQEDAEGFTYPVVDQLSCNDCGLCEKVCPVINQGKERVPLSVHAAKNRNEEVRLKSSSGGIFTLLAEHVIQKKGVVFGARFDDKWEVVHDFTETLSGLAAFRGSKYVQSRIEKTFRSVEHFLKVGRSVLFSGTPCQTAGLKLFLKKDYDNLFTVDFVCHGVPSPKVWRVYLSEIKSRPKGEAGKNTVLLFPPKPPLEITDISFRDKTTGWKKFGFVVRKSASEADQNSVLLSEILTTNVYMRGFLKNLYLRPSCHNCPARSFKSGSDITIGDYWGIHGVLPDFDDDKGVSLVIINSNNGLKVYKSLDLESIETSLEDAVKGNPVIKASVQIPVERSKFFSQVNGKSFAGLIADLTYIPFLERLKGRIWRYASAIARRAGFKSFLRENGKTKTFV